MSVEESILNQIRINMGCSKKEKILILNDYLTIEQFIKNFDKEIINRSLFTHNYYEILLKNNYKADFLAYPCTFKHGDEPPENISEKMLEYDVIIMLTSFSLSHTKARKKASEKGVRIASIPGFFSKMYDDVMNADYKKIKKLTERIGELINGSKKAVVKTSSGTNISFELAEPLLDTGIYHKEGDFGNLPAGEVCLAPRNAEGVYVVPKRWYPGLEKDMKFVVKKGMVEELIGGGDKGNELKELIFEKKHRRKVAELGIGTNKKAGRIQSVLESEKILGTIHMAVGDNTSYPGGENRSDIHIDFVIPEPTLILDGKNTLLEKGSLKF